MQCVQAQQRKLLVTQTPTPTTPSTAAAADLNAGDTRQQRKQALRREECARRSLRFLPEQVMRPIYERAGLL